jgi:hypothetical protein
LDILLESFIVHVYLSHRLFLSSIREPIEPVLESLVIVLELIFDFLFFELQLIHGVTCQVSTIDLLSI